MAAIATTEFVEIVLSCASWQEAHNIAEALLKAHLIACCEFIPIQSKYWWKQSLEQADEIKLVMQTRSKNFDKISGLVDALHSYETPSLHAVPIAIISEHAREWLDNSTEDK